MPAHPNPYHRLLGIPPAELPADHYRLLGIERLEFNADVISSAAERQVDHLNRQAGLEQSAAAEKIAREVLAARDCLLDRNRHRQYAAQVEGLDAAPDHTAAALARQQFDEQFDRAWQAAQQPSFDPLHHWLGIPPHRRPATPYQLLGVADGEQDAEVIRGAAERQLAYVRKFASGSRAEQANELLRGLARARVALSKPKRADVTAPTRRDQPRLRVDPPQPLPAPTLSEASNLLLVPAAATNQRRSELPPLRPTPTRRRPGNLSKVATAIAWIVPFVAPTMLIAGYFWWTGDGDRRIARALQALRTSSESADQVESEPDGSIGRDATNDDQDRSTAPHLPAQQHAKPAHTQTASHRPGSESQSQTSRPSFSDERQEKPTPPAAAEIMPPADSAEAIPSRAESTAEETAPKNETQSLFGQPRTWTSRDGNSSFDGVVVELLGEQVRMRRTADEKLLTFPVDRLIESDARLLRAAYFDQQDQRQFQIVEPLVLYVPQLSGDSVKLLGKTCRDLATSPYASMYLGTIKSEAENKVSAAIGIFLKVIELIDRQREIAGERHAMTLASALNNLAVCIIMDHKPDAAAAHLSRSLQVMPAPLPVILGNARLLAKAAPDSDNPLKLNRHSSRRLNEALKPYADQQVRPRDRWYYSLDVDLPKAPGTTRVDGPRYLSEKLGPASITSTLLVKHTWCVACQGAGVSPCSARGCHSGKVYVRTQGQVGRNEIINKPNVGAATVATNCRRCGGRGSFDCPHCEKGRLP